MPVGPQGFTSTPSSAQKRCLQQGGILQETSTQETLKGPVWDASLLHALPRRVVGRFLTYPVHTWAKALWVGEKLPAPSLEMCE